MARGRSPPARRPPRGDICSPKVRIFFAANVAGEASRSGPRATPLTRIPSINKRQRERAERVDEPMAPFGAGAELDVGEFSWRRQKERDGFVQRH